MTYIKSILKYTLRAIETSEDVVSSIGLATASLLIFAQVVNRYWLHFEVVWFGDLALYIFIFFMFIAATVTTWKEGHIAVDFFHQSILRGKPRAIAIYRPCIVIITIAVACALLPVVYRFMLRALQYPEYGTLVRWFNTSWLMITVFVVLVLIIIHLLTIVRRDIFNLINVYFPKSRK